MSEIKNSSIVFFYHENEDYGCFSNWFQADFYYCDQIFSSVEQFMMYHKVMMFRQYDLGREIMATKDPAIIKKLGRTKFPEFDATIWDKTCYAIVKRGVRAKFAQNDHLLEELLSTGNKTLAEASKRDAKWGIGIAIDDPERYTVSKWVGQNLLGKILMEVRDELRIASHKPDSLYPYPAEDMEFDEWFMSAGELIQNPRFAATINAYTDTLRGDWARECFLHQGTLNDWETAMRTNMGGGLPAIGFWELKQDIFDIVRLVQCLDSVEYVDRDAPLFRKMFDVIAAEEGAEYNALNEKLKNDPAYEVPQEVTDQMLHFIQLQSLANRVDFEACYDHMEALQAVLEEGDFRYKDIGRPDLEKVKALAAVYEVQTYLANRIAELQTAGVLKDDEGEDCSNFEESHK